MSTNILVIANPFDNEQVGLLEAFEKSLGLEPHMTKKLRDISASKTEAEYKNKIENAFDIILLLFNDGKIVDGCNIQGTRDIKTCNVFFAPITQKSRPIINLATDYALNGLNMEEIFVSIKSTNKNMITNLESRDFENLGEDDGYITYLKEKGDQQVQGNFVQIH